MNAQIIDGKSLAAEIREQLTQECAALKARHHRIPGLAVILIGDDPASHSYVKNKITACVQVGFRSFLYEFSTTTTESKVLAQIRELNQNPEVHGVLVQLPLPQHINANAIVQTIDPRKDVDGLHPHNQLALYRQQPTGFIPCTPLGCLHLLKTVHADLTGLQVAIINRSNLVGKPLALLLLRENCSVSLLHSKSRAPQRITTQADILVSAIGKAEFITAEWIKPGATLIDIGISWKNGHLRGDMAYRQVLSKAGAITPVPGGVGPMTIACLLKNCYTAATTDLLDAAVIQ